MQQLSLIVITSGLVDQIKYIPHSIFLIPWPTDYAINVVQEYCQNHGLITSNPIDFLNWMKSCMRDLNNQLNAFHYELHASWDNTLYQFNIHVRGWDNLHNNGYPDDNMYTIATRNNVIISLDNLKIDTEEAEIKMKAVIQALRFLARKKCAYGKDINSIKHIEEMYFNDLNSLNSSIGLKKTALESSITLIKQKGII